MTFNEFHKLPSTCRDCIESAFESDIIMTLVGGAVRDYLIKDSFPHDFDFEVRFKDTNISFTEKKIRLKKFVVSLCDKYYYNFEELSFHIFRIKAKNTEIEFSLPRIEIYEKKDSYSHDDFEVNFDQDFSYEDSFKRRDLSINAIGIEFDKLSNDGIGKYIDPYNGISDIKQEMLNNLSQDFYHDPVRFLRLLRFSINLNFKMSDQLLKNLNHFNLSQLTYFWFFKELIKVKERKEFLIQFFKMTSLNQIEYIQKLDVFKSLSDFSSINDIKDEKDILLLMILNNVEKEEIIKFLEVSNISKSLFGPSFDFFTSELVSKKNIHEELKNLTERKISELLNLDLIDDLLKLVKIYERSIVKFKNYKNFISENMKMNIEAIEKIYLAKNNNDDFIKLKTKYSIEKQHLSKLQIILKIHELYSLQFRL